MPQSDKNDTLLNKIDAKKKFPLSRTTRIILFFFLVSIEYSINVSSGLLSSASKIIKDSLKMNDTDFGLFGTCYGIGRVLGSLFFMLASDTLNRKYILIIFLFVKSIFLITFKLVTGGRILILIRSIIGFTHMPPSIFIPVWIDQFGLKKYKTLQMTLLTVLIPTGKVTGYFSHVVFGDENWRMGFFLEGCYLLFVTFVILISPYQYLSKDVIAVKDEDSRESLFAINEVTKTTKKNTQSNVNYCELLTNKVYVVAVLTRAIMTGVLTAFHYWISDYMRNRFDITDNKQIFFSYSVMAVAGPLGGILFNSLIVSLFGGYDSKNSVWVLLMMHIITCILGVSVPFMNNLYGFCGITMIFLSLTSATMPFIQGTIISSVSPNVKGAAYSIANLFHMTVTSGFTPLMYGYINEKYKSVFKGMALLSLMSLECIDILLIIVLGIVKKGKKKQEEKKENGKELNTIEKDEETLDKPTTKA